jgi:hypothetical protein
MQSTSRSNMECVLVNNLEGTSAVECCGPHSSEAKRGSDFDVMCHANMSWRMIGVDTWFVEGTKRAPVGIKTLEGSLKCWASDMEESTESISE